MTMAAYALALSLLYAVLSLWRPEVADPLIIGFVAAIVIPATTSELRELLHVLERRRTP